jgi:hypothetical protein
VLVDVLDAHPPPQLLRPHRAQPLEAVLQQPVAPDRDEPRIVAAAPAEAGAPGVAPQHLRRELGLGGGLALGLHLALQQLDAVLGVGVGMREEGGAASWRGLA